MDGSHHITTVIKKNRKTNRIKKTKNKTTKTESSVWNVFLTTIDDFSLWEIQGSCTLLDCL